MSDMTNHAVGPGTSELFRREVVEGRRARLQGEVLLARPFSSHALIALVLTFVIAAGVWIGVGRYARVEAVAGIVETVTPSAKVFPLRSGIVASLAVREGQQVRKGDTLAVILLEQDYAEGVSASREGIDAIAAQRSLSAVQVRSTQARMASEQEVLSAVMRNADRQHADLLMQAELQRELVNAHEAAVARLAPVAARGFVTQAEVDRRRMEVIAARQALSRLEQQAASAASEGVRAKGQMRQAQAEAATQIATARSADEGLRLHGAQLRSGRTSVLVAPLDGTVAVLQTAVGRLVDASLPVMAIVPPRAVVHVDLYAPSRAIGFVRPNQEVSLMYDAFPFQRFGAQRGRVVAVSRVALAPKEIAAPIRSEEPVYRITVRPDAQTIAAFGENVPLEAGMTLTANVVLERRSFVDWLLEPLRAVTRRNA